MSNDIITKRLRYFTNQFMEEPDFTDEQNYLLNRHHLHNQLLHTPGIARGLEVRKTGAKEVTVSSGFAINEKGQELFLLQDETISINEPEGTEVYISISYAETPTDRQSEDQEGTETRITEEPKVQDTTTEPDDDKTVLLAKFTLETNGNVPNELGGGVRKSVSSILADDAVSVRKLKKQESKTGVIEGRSIGEAPPIEVFRAPLDNIDTPNSVFLLVYAYSPNEGAKFTWQQIYRTESNEAIQEVVFKNELSNVIDIHYTIYTVLEN